MIFDADIGNSRLKWRLCDGTRQLHSGSVGLADLDSLKVPILKVPMDRPVTRVRAACVAGVAIEQRFAAWCERRFALTPEFARVQQKLGDVTVAYDSPTVFGVDRWLAMLAAYRKIKGACIVVDAGSALTADFIDNEGTHLGGLILPGIRLMRDALLAQTHGVKPDLSSVPQKWQPGRDTMSGVANGIAASFSGLAGEILRYGEKHLGNPVALVCGGDAEDIACRDDRFVIETGLVLDGLPIALGDQSSGTVK
jgi:type III pantothenate kinase